MVHPLRRLLGVIPVQGSSPTAHPRAELGAQPPPPSGVTPVCPAAAGALCWYLGPVLHSNSVYTVFLTPSGLSFPAGYVDRVNAYFADQAAASGTRGNVYSTDTQYYDSTGNAGYQSTVAGTTTDSVAADCSVALVRPNCVSDSALTTKLDGVIAAHGWPRGLGPVYFVFLPQGANLCAGSTCAYQPGGFCAYHSLFGSGPTLYAAEPFAAQPGCDTGESPNASSADAVINTASHEHNEIITDPTGSGWQDQQGNENGDLCARSYGPALGGASGARFNQSIGSGRYFLQEEFSNADNGCVQSLPARPPSADFAAATNPPLAGRPTTFNASVTAPDHPAASITWDFGDNTGPASGASVSHVFAAAGPYTVTLKVIDSIGLRTEVSHVIQVSTPDPRAAFSVSARGRLLTFDGSASSEAGGAITAWTWSFGDGTQGTGRVVTHRFTRGGSRTVTLTVQDAAGAGNTASQRIAARSGLLRSFGLLARQSVRSVLRKGLRVRVNCPGRCRESVTVAIGARQRTVHARGKVVLVRVPGGARPALRASRLLTLTVRVARGSERDADSKTLRLRR